MLNVNGILKKNVQYFVLMMLVLFISNGLLAQQPESDVIMQGFYWNSHPGDITTNDGVWWDTLTTVANELADDGFHTVWTPPPSKGYAGVYDMGYGIYDYFDFGDINQKGTTRTRHGNRVQLEAMIAALHNAGLSVMVDVVLNHRGGAEAQQLEDCDDGDGRQIRYTAFNPMSGRLPMNASSFHPNSFPGHCNLDGPYHSRIFFEDICYFNFLDQVLDSQAPSNGWYYGPHNLGDVGDSLIVWGRFLHNVLGFDEVRLDAVKHIEPGFLAPFLVELANGNQPFAVGEFFDGDLNALKSYHDQVESFVSTFGTGSKDANLAIFDFNLRYALRDMANNTSGGYDMWNLNFRGLRFNPGGALPAEDIVTFVENHDTDRGGYRVVSCPGPIQYGNTCLEKFIDSGHDPVIFDKHMAYAYIMAAEGRPTVFWKDWYWYHLAPELRWQMALRRETAGGLSNSIVNLSPFFTAGNGGDLFVLTRAGSGNQDGLVLAMNDNPGAEYSVYVNSPFQDMELRDYSDAYLFQSTRAFGDTRVQVKAGPRNYAWYAPTGLYPQSPGEPISNFTLGNYQGAKLHYVVLRAADAPNFVINGAPIDVGDEIAILHSDGIHAAGLGRVGQTVQWDGVHDMIIEVLGGATSSEAKGGLLSGQPLQLAVYDQSTGVIKMVADPSFAPSGTNFTFSALRPPSRDGNTPFGLTVSDGSGNYQVGAISLISAFDTATPVCQTSDAAGAAYTDGWQNGDNDGNGFNSWQLSSSGSAGYFVSSSTGNGDGDSNGDGDIDTGGRAWGLYANSGGTSEAIRPFTAPLAVGDQFKINMDNGFVENGGVVGFGLQNASGNNLVEFYFHGGQADYKVNDAAGENGTGVGFTDEGLSLTITLTGAMTVSMEINPLRDVPVNTSATLINPGAGGQQISRVRLFNFNAGFDPPHDAYFNSIEICRPPENLPPNCSGATIADQSADAKCQATISGAYVNGVTDPDDDPLTITVSPTTLNGVGAHTVTVTADDGNGGMCSTDITVNVVDDSDPVITAISDPIELWPPNHKYVTIDASECVVSVSDNCSSLSASNVYIASVSSDEEENAPGEEDGNTVDDIVISQDCKSVEIRRERMEGGNGRVYTITLAVDDESGNTGTATCQITVLHSQNGDPAMDDGAAYTITGECGTNSFAKGGNRGNSGESPAVLTADNFMLEQNYPNPFNPTTQIRFSIPEASTVSLRIYNSTGQLVKTLVSSSLDAGYHSFQWDATNDSGQQVAAGVYLYRIRAGNFIDTKKMILMK